MDKARPDTAPGHLVALYRDDEEFTELVAGFLRPGIGDEGGAVLIGTAEHRRMVQARLASDGLDLVGAGVSGRYLALDASDLMRRFVVAGWPDPGGFWRVISPLVRKQAEAGLRVSVGCDMVALLWDAGLVSAAIELEVMWNELAAHYPFALLCGYPARSVAGEHHAAALAQVRRLHEAGRPRA